MRGPALRPYRTRADSLATCHTSHTPNRHSARSTLHCSCNHSTQNIKHIDPCTTQALKLSRLGPTPDVDDTTVRQHDCTTARPAQPHRNTVAQRRRDHAGLSVSTHAHVSEGQRRREETTSSLNQSTPTGRDDLFTHSINQRRREETTSRANASSTNQSFNQPPGSTPTKRDDLQGQRLLQVRGAARREDVTSASQIEIKQSRH